MTRAEYIKREAPAAGGRRCYPRAGHMSPARNSGADRPVRAHLRGVLAACLMLLAAASGAAQAQDPDAAMAGLYGEYPMAREGSGTSWAPDSTPMSVS